ANASSSYSSDMLNFLWITFLAVLSMDIFFTPAALEEFQTNHLLLPGESDPSLRSLPRCQAAEPGLNYRPVIGIVSHPGDGASGRLSNATNASYIAASYVKFVESAGARVIPLIYNEPPEKLNLVNGVIFTGGSVKTGPYFDIVESVFKTILQRNEAGDHFPLLAICLGFELLTMIVSEDNEILENFSAVDQVSALQFVDNSNVNGTVFQRFPPDLLHKLSTDCLVMQNHRYGISPDKLQNNEKLNDFFTTLTTTADEDGKVYVSTAQAHRFPVTAVQWHPEKNAFEWGSSRIPHSDDAVRVTQHVANFFVREARLSKIRPQSKEVLDNLIYNYSPAYSGKAGSGFDEVYIF
ncbi:hypothetical protein M569_12307, partial [Genlisea aurea]